METDITMVDILSLMEWSNNGLNKKYVQLVTKYLNENLKEEFSFADVGCGTGLLFTLPLFYYLQENKLLTKLIGYDVDIPSVEWGNKAAISFFDNGNRIEFKPLRYIKNSKGLEYILEPLPEKYDIVSCNAVLEHTKKPEMLLDFLSSIMKPNGILFISIPNGCGPFEIDSYMYRSFVGPVFLFLRKIKRMFIPSILPPPPHAILQESLNHEYNSHVYFFTEKKFACLLKKAGLSIVYKKGEGFLSGPIYNTFLMKIKWITRLNNYLSTKAPFCFSNMWYFIIKMEQ